MPETHKISRAISIPGFLRRLKFLVWFKERVHPSELQVTLVWAGIIGFCGALCSIGFRIETGLVHKALTGSAASSLAESFAQLSP